MVEYISVAKKLTAAAGASDSVILYTVPEAAKLKITHVRIHFPTGSNGLLEVALKAGLRYLYPTHNKASGDNTLWEFRTPQELTSGSIIEIEYTNNDSSNPHTCFILLEGAVER